MLRLLLLSCGALLLLLLLLQPPNGTVIAMHDPTGHHSPEDYCRTDLCPGATEHIGCIKNKEFSPNCGQNNKLISVNGALRQRILQSMNLLRNMVASGMSNMSVAARMPTMGWDKDLEHLSSMLVRQCDHESKYCSNLDKYHYVATAEITGQVKKRRSIATAIIEKLLPSWFMDLMGCRMDQDQRVVPIAEGTCVGHYVPLIEDNGDRMGCAIRTQPDENATFWVTLLCQFSRANVNNMLPYEVGTVPGEKCSAGKSQLYKYLCNQEEMVDANLVEDRATDDSNENNTE